MNIQTDLATLFRNVHVSKNLEFQRPHVEVNKSANLLMKV